MHPHDLHYFVRQPQTIDEYEAMYNLTHEDEYFEEKCQECGDLCHQVFNHKGVWMCKECETFWKNEAS